jgi:hypothetical protein
MKEEKLLEKASKNQTSGNPHSRQDRTNLAEEVHNVILSTFYKQKVHNFSNLSYVDLYLRYYNI